MRKISSVALLGLATVCVGGSVSAQESMVTGNLSRAVPTETLRSAAGASETNTKLGAAATEAPAGLKALDSNFGASRELSAALGAAVTSNPSMTLGSDRPAGSGGLADIPTAPEVSRALSAGNLSKGEGGGPEGTAASRLAAGKAGTPMMLGVTAPARIDGSFAAPLSGTPTLGR